MATSTPASLAEFLASLDSLAAAAVSAFAQADSAAAIEQARVEFLGARQGRLKAIQKAIAGVPAADKPHAGQRLNEVMAQIQSALAAAQQRVAAQSSATTGDQATDPTEPGTPFRLGRLHPITQTIHDLQDILGRLGFTTADGPEIEDEWHNFQALNIPPDHPARDPLENFYLSVAQRREGPLLLRSQTSTVQIRAMEQERPPLRIISLGRVYRPDTADASHYPMFHQMEGLMVDRDVSLATLKTLIGMFTQSYFGADVPIRVRPSFFPFTEPSVEVDYHWNGRWMELGGAGVVDPAVLTAVGIDPDEWSGLAFGMGIERFTMIRHQITDIRHLFTNDVRFLRQF